MACCTDAGIVRSHNEDSVSSDTSIGLVVLADGMGGYNAGEVASGMTTAVITTEMRKVLVVQNPAEMDTATGRPIGPRLLLEQITKANAAVYEASQTQPQYSGMGTTLVTALFYNNGVTFAHIGDSRGYRLRDGTLTQVTKDHSLLQEQIDNGLITSERARYSNHKNLVTRALGIDQEVDAEITQCEALPGDIYLLCSDGLNDMVPDEDIGMTMQALSANLKLAAQQLVQLANDNGGRDNISVILVRVLHDYAASRGGLVSRILGWLR
ncbi:MAG: Stp1/IreP family PP2C-type Ser/Thr phosphatase [Betaproteobacteria bacterium]|nr:Stp1/IreP family PP2C-type Ser/Thr phosphatase [Betaproteobacteria bacterium]